MKLVEFDAWKFGTFSIKMTEEDAWRGCHSGRCDYDCEQLIEEDYIRKQLDEISDEQMTEVLKEYGIEDADSKTRHESEMYIVWLAAGDIVDGNCDDIDE